MSILIIEKREATGTVAARQCRGQHKIPAIVYGKKQQSSGGAVDEIEIFKRTKNTSLKSKVIDIDFAGKKAKALVKDIQRHVVTDKIIHMDFLLLDNKDIVKVFVPFRAVNAALSPGVKKGGIINLVLHSIELSLPAESIPDFIEIDLDGLSLNHSILLKDVKLPERCRIVKADLNDTLLTIIPPSGLRAKMSAEEGEEAEEGIEEDSEE